MAEALVSKDVMRWARERAGLPVDVLARKLGVNPDAVADWESGAKRPTFRQAEKLADATHVPFGFLFLDAPPEENLPIPDLRSGTRSAQHPLDTDPAFMDTLQDVLFKHAWYRDYRVEQGQDPLAFVGRFSSPAKPMAVAEDMRRELAIGPAERREVTGWEEFFRLIVSRAEKLGIWVMRNGVVGSNSHRPLSVSVFRGFAIADDLAPLVFINARDARSAQFFTLAHELAHIWIGRSGVSNMLADHTGEGGEARGVERLCNEAAAEFLVPATELRTLWDKGADMATNARTLCPHFRVSRIALAIKARSIGLTEEKLFHSFISSEIDRSDPKSTGGDFYLSARSRNGDRFMKAVLASAISGGLLLREACGLLSMSVPSVIEAHHRQVEGTL